MDKLDEKKQDRIILKNSVFSVGFKGLSYLLSFITTPVLLNCLGDYKYGIYTTALSLISWIYYFDFGIGSGLRNKLTSAVVKKEFDKAQDYINVSYFIIGIISFVAFGVILLLSLFIDFDTILNANLKDENLNYIIVIAILIACINFVISLSKNILLSVQKTALVDGFGIASKIIMLLALVVYSKTGSSAMLVIVIIEGISELIKNIIASIYISKKYKYLTPSFSRRVKMGYSRDILSFGIQIFVMQIAALILNATDNVIIMKLFSAADVTPYNLGHKFFSIINAFFVAATGSLWTAYTTAYTVNDVKYIKKTLGKSLLFYACTLIAIICAFYIFKPFMRIYIGHELEYQEGLIVLIALYYAILIFSHNFSSFVHGISKVKITTIASIVSAGFNIPCSIFCATVLNMGINGVILGSIISLLITTPCYVFTTYAEIRKMSLN